MLDWLLLVARASASEGLIVFDVAVTRCCWEVTLLSVALCTQQLPNMKVSMHTPTCVPSDLMHSQTNMHVPSVPFGPGTLQGFGLIL